jgi:hypothetical protein
VQSVLISEAALRDLEPAMDSLNLAVVTGIALYSGLKGEGYPNREDTKFTKRHEGDSS